MKSSIVVAVVAAVAGALAQSSSSAMTTGPSISYVYSYYDDCSTTSGQGNVTDTITSTHCSECTGMASSSAGGSSTTYTTVYKEFCSTGLQDKTYTVTESCSSPHPASAASREAGYVPQGFAVTTATCHVCGPMPVVATLTTPTPVAPTANAGAGPAPAAAGETGASSPGAVGSSPAPGESSPQAGESYPVSGSSASAAAPYATTARYASALTGAPGFASPGNSSAPITPFTGTASGLSIYTSFMFGAMGLMGVLAFAL